MASIMMKGVLGGIMLAGVALGACDAQTADRSAQGPAAQVPATQSATPGLAQAEKGDVPQSDVPPPSREVFTDAACDYEAWVGKPVDEAAVKATGKTYRILTPDSMMTMDFNAERLNVVHDKGKVTRVWCG